MRITTLIDHPINEYQKLKTEEEYTFVDLKFKNQIIALLKSTHFTACRKIENLMTPDRIALILFTDESVRTVNIWGRHYFYTDGLIAYAEDADLFSAIKGIVVESQNK